ncbi:MAG: PP2C family protein-serine/threonine phosphatase, partial [Actinomycetota bacterium]
HRLYEKLVDASGDSDGIALARADYHKDLHTASLYGVTAVALVAVAVNDPPRAAAALAIVGVPAVITLFLGRGFVRQARVALGRTELERRAQEVLTQEELAPRRWAERLAPEQLPDLTGFEVGRVYQAGTGMMAGDFYDVFRVAPTRVAAVVGDVTGHGIEASITAFQAKYLLRIFLRQFRDPAQALEELNAQMSAMTNGEEFISLVVVVFDTEAGTLRYTSAGHPATWLWHGRELQPLRATGPILMLDPQGGFYSREIPLDPNDLCLLYTDGLAEARNGDDLFGEERIAQNIKKDPGVAADVLCKSLLEAARDFATGPIDDDVAILAIRRE